MNVGARLSLLVAMLVILGACGLPSETGGSPSTTTVPLADSEEPAMAIISVTACRETDPWTMVETAFQGTVTAIEPEAAGTEGDTLQVVSFDVTSWYTTDYGTTFSMWAPNFDGQIGDTWLVAGALYPVNGQQSGEVFPCVSIPSSDTARREWDNRLGSSV